MHKKGVLIDTSFLIRLLATDDALYKNANEYFKYCLNQKITMWISTIAIAEFTVKGNVDDLPIINFKVLPFNYQEAKRAGELARIIFDKRKNNEIELKDRAIIPNDVKLFAQADVSKNIEYYLSSDEESFKIYNISKDETDINFHFISLKTPIIESILLEESTENHTLASKGIFKLNNKNRYC